MGVGNAIDGYISNQRTIQNPIIMEGGKEQWIKREI
jgi:hypothetical protein